MPAPEAGVRSAAADGTCPTGLLWVLIKVLDTDFVFVGILFCFKLNAATERQMASNPDRQNSYPHSDGWM